MTSRKSHPSILDVSPAFLYYFHISENAAAETLSAPANQEGQRGAAGADQIRGPGTPEHRPAHPARRPERSQTQRERQAGTGSTKPQQRDLPEIHSSREARALPETVGEDGRRPVVP